MHPDYPEPVEFVVPTERERVTGEPARTDEERWRQQHYMAMTKMGGGYVPPDYAWSSSPKEEQDEYGVTQIAGAAALVRLAKKAEVIERGRDGGLPTG